MVNQADDDYVVVGRFGRVYGIKGFIHINLLQSLVKIFSVTLHGTSK